MKLTEREKDIFIFLKKTYCFQNYLFPLKFFSLYLYSEIKI